MRFPFNRTVSEIILIYKILSKYLKFEVMEKQNKKCKKINLAVIGQSYFELSAYTLHIQSSNLTSIYKISSGI